MGVADDQPYSNEGQMTMIKTNLTFPNGDQVPHGFGVCVDNLTTSFDIVIHPLETVGSDDLKDLIQTKFEVTKIEQYGGNNFFVQIRTNTNVNESLKDLIETKFEVESFNETAQTGVVNGTLPNQLALEESVVMTS